MADILNNYDLGMWDNSSNSNCTTIECHCDQECIRQLTREFELLSPTVELFLTVPYVALTVLSTLSNMIIICIIIFNDKLRTTQNYLIANLAVSDLLICIFCIPSTLLLITDESQWIFGYTLCKVSGSTNVTKLLLPLFRAE